MGLPCICASSGVCSRHTCRVFRSLKAAARTLIKSSRSRAHPDDPLNTFGSATMRYSQIAIFLLVATSLTASAFGIGKDYGETFYNAGIALLVLDVVCIQLWPSTKRP